MLTARRFGVGGYWRTAMAFGMILACCFILGRFAMVRAALTQWDYIDLGDTGDNGWALNFGDVNGDGWPDMTANHYVFISPGEDVSESWRRVLVSSTLKGYFIYDLDDDGLGDIIANTQQTLYYLHTRDENVSGWDQHVVANNIVPDHNTFEGYVLADFVPGGRLEVMLAWGDKTWNMYKIPDNPTQTWPSVQCATSALDEDMAAGYIDDDTLLDIAGGTNIAWWKNPGNGTGDWPRHSIGQVTGKGMDRGAIADLNGDGNADLFTVCDATRANVAWFENPGNPEQAGSWPVHLLDDVGGEAHGGAVGDLDADCDMDAMAGSTTGQFNMKIYENDGEGNFTSVNAPGSGDLHNTGRIFDIDKDGDLDMIGIGWVNHNVRIWRNNNPQENPCKCLPEIQPEGTCEPDAARPAQQNPDFRAFTNPDNVRVVDSRGRSVANLNALAAAGTTGLPKISAAGKGVYFLVAEKDGVVWKKKVAAVR
jgi:hypothetical protein